MKAYIYWLHLPEHDNYSQGYIGVSRNPKQRLLAHRKSRENDYLKNVLQKYDSQIQQHIIWVGEEHKCYIIEEELRPEERIGWNLNKGGRKPPSMRGRRYTCEKKKTPGPYSEERIKKQVASHKGKKHKPMIQSAKNLLIGNQRSEKQKAASRKHSERMMGRSPWNKRG